MVASLTSERLGASLRRAREMRGISQQQAARHLGFKNHQPILRIESGQRDVSTVELSELAKLYRRPLSFFVLPEGEEGPEEDYTVLFRASGLGEQDLAEVDRIARRCKEFAFLSKALDLIPGAAQSAQLNHEAPRNRGHAVMQGERLAVDARRILGLDDQEPIADLHSLLEEQGIGVFATRLPQNVSGLCLGSARTSRCIVVNAEHRAARNVFTSAHEFCHLLLGEAAHVCHDSEPRDLGEARAEHFAGALLMPKAGLEGYRRDALKVDWRDLNPVHVVDLQFYFRVSYLAVLVRLRRLELITEAQYGRLQAVGKEQLARLAGHDEEQEVPRPKVFERRMRALAVEAYRLGKISRGRLAEILGIDFDQIGEFLQGLGIPEPPVVRRPNRNNPLLEAAS